MALLPIDSSLSREYLQRAGVGPAEAASTVEVNPHLPQQLPRTSRMSREERERYESGRDAAWVRSGGSAPSGRLPDGRLRRPRTALWKGPGRPAGPPGRPLSS